MQEEHERLLEERDRERNCHREDREALIRETELIFSRLPPEDLTRRDGIDGGMMDAVRGGRLWPGPLGAKQEPAHGVRLPRIRPTWLREGCRMSVRQQPQRATLLLPPHLQQAL